MASFRSAVGVRVTTTSEIDVDFPADIVAGDLLIMFVVKTQTDRPVTPAGWFNIGDFDHGVGTRRVSMACWTIATAAMVSAGEIQVVCTTSNNDGTMFSAVLAFDITDWAGLVWNTSAFLHATSGTTKASSSLDTIFVDGISLVFHAVGVTSRSAAGTTTEGGVVFDNDDTDTVSARVWYNVAETAELAQIATVGNAGTIDATQVGFAAFGPSPQTSGDPCADPDGSRTAF